ncbi:MAG TPA: type II toxin-antitoxin system ParD family antitoxin [Tepidisphaeraceae bacterium]|nr:type II toxin-antitoxin system ParD family antitoxin [Tepidisphaeraceae bacterium]
MNISLTKETQRIIEDRMKHGRYVSTDALIRAGLDALEQQESLGDFEPGEMDALLAEGQNSGPSLDGEQVLSELRALRSNRPSKAG